MKRFSSQNARRALTTIYEWAKGNASRDNLWWWPPQPSVESLVYGPLAKPSRAIFVTKMGFTEQIMCRPAPPSDMLIVTRHALLGEQQEDWMGRFVAGLKVPWGFLGDLSPLGWTVYLSLVASVPRAMSPPSFVGITDSLIRLYKKHHRAAHAGEVRMSKVEMEHTELLLSLGLDWQAIAGPMSVATLKSGIQMGVDSFYPKKASNAAYVRSFWRLIDSAYRHV
ncbi:hypothetical protein BH09MYX1_BH09MYX1_11460 [soil metagenome]